MKQKQDGAVYTQMLYSSDAEQSGFFWAAKSKNKHFTVK
jgi:hypothetical protein